MSKDKDFSLTGIDKDVETDLETLLEEGKPAVNSLVKPLLRTTPKPPAPNLNSDKQDTKTGRDEHGKKAQDELDRGRTTLQRIKEVVNDKGLNPLKNGNSIFLTVYSLLLCATIHRLEQGNYQHLFYYIAATVTSFLCIVVTEKGDLQTILRQIWLISLTRIGAKAEVKAEKQSENTVFERVK